MSIILGKRGFNFYLVLLGAIYIFFSYIGQFSLIQYTNTLITLISLIVYVIKSFDSKILMKIIIFLMIFDINEVFTFGGSLNLRIWYFLIPILVFQFMLQGINRRELDIKKNNIVITLVILVISLTSIFINGSNVNGVLYLARLILFYFPILLCFIKLIKDKRDLDEIFKFLNKIILFSTIIGLVQYLLLVLGIDINYSRGTLRPQAFFSETTWYSEYALIGIVITLMGNFYKRKATSIIILLNFLAIMVSLTRTSIMGLVLIMIVYFIKKKYFIKGIKYTAIIGVFLILYDKIASKNKLIGLSFIIDKFTFNDASAQGRFDAIMDNLEFFNTPKRLILGSGFSFSSANEISGSAIGAKSFNLFLAVLSSCGIVVLIILIFIILKLYYEYMVSKNKSEYMVLGIWLFTIYLMYSMLKPYFFYPLSWPILALSIKSLNTKEINTQI